MQHADEQFEQFVQAYPAGRRQRGFIVTQLFLAAVGKVGFATLMTAVQQQTQSAQWENPLMIPLMKKWLEEERWIQVLPGRRMRTRASVTRIVPDDEPL